MYIVEFNHIPHLSINIINIFERNNKQQDVIKINNLTKNIKPNEFKNSMHSKTIIL